MGSDSDLEHAKMIGQGLGRWKIGYEPRVASAHKHPEYILRMLEEYDNNSGLSIVYITVAGRSDALTGFVAANTVNPVIGCPPYSDKYGGMSMLSTVYLPSRTPGMFVQDTDNAAQAAVRMFAKNSEELRAELERFLKETKDGIETADRKVRGRTDA